MQIGVSVCVCVCTVQTHTQQADRDTKYVNMGLWEGGGREVTTLPPSTGRSTLWVSYKRHTQRVGVVKLSGYNAKIPCIIYVRYIILNPWKTIK